MRLRCRPGGSQPLACALGVGPDPHCGLGGCRVETRLHSPVCALCVPSPSPLQRPPGRHPDPQPRVLWDGKGESGLGPPGQADGNQPETCPGDTLHAPQGHRWPSCHKADKRTPGSLLGTWVGTRALLPTASPLCFLLPKAPALPNQPGAQQGHSCEGSGGRGQRARRSCLQLARGRGMARVT